jgi:hypothetical protein
VRGSAIGGGSPQVISVVSRQASIMDGSVPCVVRWLLYSSECMEAWRQVMPCQWKIYLYPVSAFYFVVFMGAPYCLCKKKDFTLSRKTNGRHFACKVDCTHIAH